MVDQVGVVGEVAVRFGQPPQTHARVDSRGHVSTVVPGCAELGQVFGGEQWLDGLQYPGVVVLGAGKLHGMPGDCTGDLCRPDSCRGVLRRSQVLFSDGPLASVRGYIHGNRRCQRAAPGLRASFGQRASGRCVGRGAVPVAGEETGGGP